MRGKGKSLTSRHLCCLAFPCHLCMFLSAILIFLHGSRVHQIFRNFLFAQNAYNKWVPLIAGRIRLTFFSLFTHNLCFVLERSMKTSRGESRNLCFRALESEYLNPKLIVLKFFIVQIKCSLYLAKLKSKALAKPLFISGILIFLSLHFRCRCPSAPWTRAR